MGVCLVLLALGTSLDVFLYVLSLLWPPVVLGYQLPCSVDTGVSVGWHIMVSLDDFVLVLSCSCDHFAHVLPPFSVHLFEIVGSCPLLYYSFVLLWRLWGYVGQGSSSNEHFFRKHYDVLIIFFSLVVVGSSRQHVCSPILSPRDVLQFDIVFR